MMTIEERRIYNRKNYKKRCDEPDYMSNRVKMARDRRMILRAFVTSCKINKKCKCGESDIRCMDFHHRDPKTKLHNVSDMPMKGLALSKIRDEIAKCDLICSNCHRKETFK